MTSSRSTTLPRSLLLSAAVAFAGVLAGPPALDAQERQEDQPRQERAQETQEEGQTWDYESASAEAEAGALQIREWDVPWEETRPRDPYVGPDGRVWFVGQRADYVAYLEPETGEFRRYDLEEGAGPHTLIVAEDGTVWYAGNRAAHIGKLDPETGEITKVDMPDPGARDPHTMAFDSRGDIWFTVQGGNMVGHLDTETHEVRLVEVPTEGARPYGIKVSDEDRPWIAMVGTNKLSTVDPQTMELREVELPRAEARPRRLEITPDGRVWYVDYAQGHLGVYDPDTGEFEEWTTPFGTESAPYGMASDDEGRLWFVETEPTPNRFIGFDPERGEFLAATPVPSGGGTVRHMYYDPATDQVWFGADTNTIGRADLP